MQMYKYYHFKKYRLQLESYLKIIHIFINITQDKENILDINLANNNMSIVISAF